MFLLLLETVGTTELLVILLVALIIFGPRKLPQMARKVGQTMAEFKRASADFQRTWEVEVEQEQATRAAQVERAMLPDEAAPAGADRAGDAGRAAETGEEGAGAGSAHDDLRVVPESRSIARGAANAWAAESASESQSPAAEASLPPAPAPLSKRDWL